MDRTMNTPDDKSGPEHASANPLLKRGQTAQMQRDKRSKLALKANMARRKEQARARETEAANQGSPEDK
jgi:hypothetical protein